MVRMQVGQIDLIDIVRTDTGGFEARIQFAETPELAGSETTQQTRK